MTKMDATQFMTAILGNVHPRGNSRTVGNAIRAFWHFGPPDNPQAVSGMDFVILDGEKASHLYAFVDDPR